jgi:hypothetical protein
MNRTRRVIGGVHNPLVRVELNELTLFKEQKRLKDGWAANNKEPEYTAIALDITSAAKAFEKVKTLLTRVRGVLGVPLVYVIRHILIPKDDDNDPAIGEEDAANGLSKYTSIDHETITRCPIVTKDVDWDLELDEIRGSGIKIFT